MKVLVSKELIETIETSIKNIKELNGKIIGFLSTAQEGVISDIYIKDDEEKLKKEGAFLLGVLKANYDLLPTEIARTYIHIDQFVKEKFCALMDKPMRAITNDDLESMYVLKFEAGYSYAFFRIVNVESFTPNTNYFLREDVFEYLLSKDKSEIKAAKERILDSFKEVEVNLAF